MSLLVNIPVYFLYSFVLSFWLKYYLLPMIDDSCIIPPNISICTPLRVIKPSNCLPSHGCNCAHFYHQLNPSTSLVSRWTRVSSGTFLLQYEDVHLPVARGPVFFSNIKFFCLSSVDAEPCDTCTRTYTAHIYMHVQHMHVDTIHKHMMTWSSYEFPADNFDL